MNVFGLAPVTATRAVAEPLSNACILSKTIGVACPRLAAALRMSEEVNKTAVFKVLVGIMAAAQWKYWR
ncbi:hypothetical protein GCM10027277_21080 [Pseudoduganella ginsengisoli]